MPPHIGQRMDPQESIRLLDALESLGFTNEAFRLLHHFRLNDGTPTINDHRTYCEGLQTFRSGGTNDLVQQRLKLVLQAYEVGGFKSGKAEVFAALAEAAFQEIPPR
jgi:hypothetical protein